MSYFYRQTKKIMTAVLIALCMTANAAFVRNLPMEIKQPDGVTLHVLASGDEHYNWVHDENNFTIVKNEQTGYYVYATKVNGYLQPTDHVVGKSDPAKLGLLPGLLDDQSIVKEKVTKSQTSRTPSKSKRTASVAQPAVVSTGNYNNIVVYIQFSDQVSEEWTLTKAESENRFNGSNTVSVNDFFKQVSANQLNVTSTFYPQSSNVYPIAYTDPHPRSYYQKNTPDGYGNDPNGSYVREHELLKNAINHISSQVPSSLNIDINDDGLVDNVVFVVKGYTDGWAELLWPHRWSLFSQNVYIGSKRVYDYNMVFGTSLGVGVISHELFHSFGAPDLYHYSSWFSGDPAVGPWDVMAGADWNTPQHMGAHMKEKYGQWTTIPEITASGTYTLQPFSTNTFSAYKIKLPNTNDYLLLEYRKKEGRYEVMVPNSGLIVSLIHPDGGNNPHGPVNEVYVFRKDGTLNAPGDIYNAAFSAGGRTSFNDNTNPACFKSDGTPCGLAGYGISNVTAAGSTISFTYTAPVVPSCTVPEWDPNIAYTSGNEVSYAGNKYSAKWWTQNNRPDLNSGSGQPWELVGPCGTVNVDPVVSITSPVQNQEIWQYPSTASPIQVLVNTNNAQTTIDSVSFVVLETLCNGPGCVNVRRFVTTTYPFTLSYQSVLNSMGYTEVTAIAFSQGVASQPSQVKYYARPLPELTILSPTENSTIAPGANSVLIDVNVNSSQIAIDSVVYTVYDTKANVTTERKFVVTSAPYDLQLPILQDQTFTTVFALAYGGQGKYSISKSVTFNYNSLPVVTITEPGSNFRFNVGGSVTIKGTAVDLDGTLTKVEIYSPHIPNSTVILTAPPYEATFTNMQSSGNRGLTTFVIKATDDKGGVNGAMIDVYENKLPVVTVTSPLPQYNNNNIVYLVGSSITVSANATDLDGTISKVEISQGSNAPVVLTAAPYTATFTNLPAPAPDGSIFFTIKAYDNSDASTSALIVAYKNRIPTIAITAPAGNTTVAAGSTINITTVASDIDGAVAKVEFFDGNTKLGESTAAPYSFSITNAVAGSYSLTAKVTDDLGESSTTSAVVVNVVANSCTVAAWSSTATYNGGNRVSKSGTVYEAKWWSQNNDPVTNSGPYDVWKVIGPCNSRLAASEALNAVTVSPVPFTEELIVNTTDEEAHIELYDMYGSKVAQKIARGTVSIETSMLSPGIYLCNVLIGGETKSFKVLKK